MYNNLMYEKILQSHIVRQLIGAMLGVIAALGVYWLSDSFTNSSVKGLLIESNPTISTSTDVRVSDATVNSKTLERLASRAMQVAAQNNGTSSVPALQLHAAVRGRTRNNSGPYSRHTEVANINNVVLHEATSVKSNTEEYSTKSAASALPSSGAGLLFIVTCALLGAFVQMKQSMKLEM